MKIIDHGVIEIPSSIVANADAIKLQNYKTNTPGKFQVRHMNDDNIALMENLASIISVKVAALDFVYFSVCKGAEPHIDLLDSGVYEPRTFVIPVILPNGDSVITAEDEQQVAKLNHIYEFNHEKIHSMELDDNESGCVVIMVAIKK